MQETTQPTLSDDRGSRKRGDFKQLRDKAGFLRGPCDTMGIYKVEGSCARLERLATEGTSAAICDTAGSLIEEAREHFWEAEKALHQLY